jgi:hypothetical protein
VNSPITIKSCWAIRVADQSAGGAAHEASGALVPVEVAAVGPVDLGTVVDVGTDVDEVVDVELVELEELEGLEEEAGVPVSACTDEVVGAPDSPGEAAHAESTSPAAARTSPDTQTRHAPERRAPRGSPCRLAFRIGSLHHADGDRCRRSSSARAAGWEWRFRATPWNRFGRRGHTARRSKSPRT